MNTSSSHPSAHEPEPAPIFKPPRKNLHSSFYAFACRCAEDGVEPEDCRAAIDEGLSSNNAKRNDNREINAAIENAYAHVLGHSPDEDRERSFPPYDSNQAEREFHHRGVTIEQLRHASPISPPEDVLGILAGVFTPDELVCLSDGPHIERASVAPREALDLSHPYELSRCSYLVPNPMTARHGTTKDGKEGRPRTQSNTGPRSRIVIDLDHPPFKWQPSILAALNEYWTPALILKTGGKGLHCWFAIGDASPEDIRTFEEIAAELGADDKLLGERSRCQWVRTPNGIRENGNKQEVIFFNPNGVEVEL